ncbi:TPA: EAL domain-containing protein [Vibrio vulnificus]|nr:EAL domain-containing protein [Vibrio vulnificus]
MFAVIIILKHELKAHSNKDVCSMAKYRTLDYEIPEAMQKSWQRIVNLLAYIVDVPAALIMRIQPEHIEVFSSSQSSLNPYHHGDSESLGHGLYCETVIEDNKELLVPNALNDKEWDHNPDIKLGMIAYCGLPLLWPNGEVFGTICMLDDKENNFGQTYRELLAGFQTSIEAQLSVVYQHQKLLRLNEQLKERVDKRTTNLAQLSFSLNQEIDRRKAAEQQAHYQKHHDHGTGFLNRCALEQHLQGMLDEWRLGDSSLVVIHIGFTNARSIQTKYGFALLDDLLKIYRNQIGVIESVDSITGRPSSHDLVIAIRADDVTDILDNLLNRIINAGQRGFKVGESEAHLHAFIGLAVADSTTESAQQLLRHANQAMVLSKDSGQQYAYFSATHADALLHHNQIESYLLQAVRNDDLTLYFQPKVCPQTHKWIGAEALLRWSHPVLGDISNEALIHMAEQNGLIFEVGAFVLRSAIEKAKEWSAIVEHFRVAVNVSAIQLKNPLFAEQVQELLIAYQLPAQYLELEVTESGLISDEAVARATLERLHELGVTLSLDDFGTGYASFSYLKKYPFDAIKIDKSFVQHIDKSEEDKEIIRSIIHVAKKLDLEVVMEGIESDLQEDFLIREGCDIGQGFLYGKPMPGSEFVQGLYSQNFLGTPRFAYHT